MIRSSYFAARARSESFAARHRQALASIGIAETEAAQSNLTFAEPQIRMARVIASIGLRRVAAARRELKAIAKHGPLDPHDQANHGIQSARLALTLGDPQHASDILQRITGVADNATRGEVLAYRSFACALLSRFSESRALWADARAATSTIEAQVISRLAEAAAASDGELPELLECERRRQNPLGFATPSCSRRERPTDSGWRSRRCAAETIAQYFTTRSTQQNSIQHLRGGVARSPHVSRRCTSCCGLGSPTVRLALRCSLAK